MTLFAIILLWLQKSWYVDFNSFDADAVVCLQPVVVVPSAPAIEGPRFWISIQKCKHSFLTDRNGAFNDGDTDPTPVDWQEEKFKRIAGWGD